MAKYISNRQQNLKIGIVSYTEDKTVLEVTGKVGIGTTNATSKLSVVGDVRVTGVVTATSFSGSGTNLTGIVTSIIAGTNVTVSGSTGQVTINSTASGGSGLSISTSTSSTPQFITFVSSASTTSIGITASNLTFIPSSGSLGIGTTNPTSKLTVQGDVNVSGVVTATTFVGALTGIATSATQLVTPRTFQITGDVVASPISFDGTGNVSLAATIQPNSVGLGTDTTGDYVRDITGTVNQISVSATSGEGSTPILSIPSQFTAPQDVTVTRDLLVSRNLNVNGNITIGGTSATLFTTELKISDPDIVLGFRTDGSGNDISNDNTANHGGVALASTEGTPLVQLFIAGIETAPATYKKIMWFKSGTFAGLGTDAWLINYAVGIGSTQFPTGTRLAAGNVQFTQNDLAVVRNVNASGIATINQLDVNQLSPDGSNYGTALYVPVANGSGGWNWATVASAGAGNLNGIDILEEGTIVGTAGSTTSIDFRGNNIIATGTAGGAIATVRVSDTPTFDSLVVSSGSTFTNGPILVGTGTSTGTASQPLQVTGGAYVSGNLGVGTTNPEKLLHLSTSVATPLIIQRTSNNNSAVEYRNTVSSMWAGIGGSANGWGVASSADVGADAHILVTRNSGELLVGTATSTGTASQKLQVTGGAYVSGNLGIGTTNPTSKLHVIGDARITGVVTATTFVGALTGTATSTTNIPNLTGAIISNNTTTSLGSFTSANLAAALTDKTGSGVAVFATSPTLVTPSLGAASATSINSSGIVTATQFVTGASGSAIGINTNTISGPATITIDPAAVGDNTGLVVIKGDLQIDGTTTTINSTTVTVDDKNIILGSGAINNAAADGSGITIESGNGNKTFQFEDTGNNLGSSENLNVASGKVYKIAGTSVLSNNTLGSGVVTSSLTSVGTLGQLQVTGVSTFTNGPILVGTATSTGTASQPLQVTGGAYVSGNLGIGTTNPGYKLDVTGNLNFTGTLFKNGVEYASGIGIQSGGSFVVGSGVTTLNFVGSAVSSITNSGGGIIEINIKSGAGQFSRSTSTFTATAGQTSFSVNYTPNFIDVFLNGVKLTSSEFTATNGTSVVLTDAAFVDDIIDVVVFQNSGLFDSSKWSAETPLTPSSGNIYRVSGNVGIGTTNPTSKLHVIGDARITGVVTATTFVGALTGTATSTTNIPNLTGAITSNNTTTSLGSFTSAQLATALTDETGTGANVFATSPVLVTPSLGIATATSIVVSSGSTFTNGPILVGTATSTGTASQPLQVTGGAYVSGNLGIGTTNPTSKLHVVGDVRVTGIVTASSFVGALTGTATSTTNIPNLTGAITSVNTTTSLGSFTSAQLATALTDETGSGANVFATSPVLVTPSLGIATATSIVVAGIVTANSSGIDLNGTVLNKSELKNYTETVYAQGNTGITTTLNLVNGNVFTATLNGNCTFTFTTGVTSGAASFTLILTNDATAGRSITWPASVKWPNNTIPVRTTTANATDIWSFFTPNNGTTWYGNVALYNFT